MGAQALPVIPAKEIGSDTKLSFRGGPRGRARNLEGSVPSRELTQAVVSRERGTGQKPG